MSRLLLACHDIGIQISVHLFVNLSTFASTLVQVHFPRTIKTTGMILGISLHLVMTAQTAVSIFNFNLYLFHGSDFINLHQPWLRPLCSSSFLKNYKGYSNDTCYRLALRDDNSDCSIHIWAWHIWPWLYFTVQPCKFVNPNVQVHFPRTIKTIVLILGIGWHLGMTTQTVVFTYLTVTNISWFTDFVNLHQPLLQP